MYFLGIESAESMTSALVVDLDSGNVLASSSCVHSFSSEGSSEAREQDPAMWIKAMDQAVRECLESLGNAADDIVAMSVAAQSKGVVLLDQGNQVIRPVRISGDRSAARQLEWLHQECGGAAALVELLGNRVEIDSAVAQLLWFKNEDPESFQRAVSAMLPREFLAYWLTGVRKAEAGEVSGSGLFDVVERKYSGRMAGLVDASLPEMLSPIADPEETNLGLLRGEIARSWGLKREIKVGLGSGLNMMRALSLGVNQAGTAVLDFRSIGSVWGLADQPAVDLRGEANLWCNGTGKWLAHFDEERAVSTLEMVRSHYGWSGLEMEQAAAGAAMGADGLLVLPLGHGSRSGKGEGVFHGITTANFTQGNVARATLEGIATGLSFGFHRMIELGLEFEEIRIAGRGVASRFWRQLISDVAGIPGCALINDEGTAMGAAMQAAVNYFREMGQYMSFSELTERVILVDEESRCSPRRDRHDYYLERLSRQQYFAETLTGAGFLD
ncbi:MAG: FGGY family carbohydrate kinase [Akkermansiaceae bacterium]